MNLKIYILLSILMIISLPLYSAENDIAIDASIEYQTIDNFAASDCWSMQKIGAWVTPQKERVADLLFSTEKGIGLSAWRFNIGGGINVATIRHPWRTVETFELAQGEYDWTRQQEERWFLDAAQKRGVDQFIAFVNSPPGRMTRNGYTNGANGVGSTNLRSGFEAQFAVYLVDILKHFKEEWDINFNYISPVNEPQWEWNSSSNQEGNRAANDDIKKMVNELYPRLQSENLDTEIMIVESGDLRSWYQSNSGMESEYGKKYGEYFGLVTDNEVKSKISHTFCGHSYWSDRLNTQLVQDRQNLSVYLNPLLNAGWKYWMSEYAVLDGPEGAGGRGRDLTMKTALDVTRVMHYDLTILNTTAWQWWTAVSPEDYKDGLIYTDYMENPTSQNIIESKLLWAFGNYSRFIRPGSIRIELTGADDKNGLLGSAYVDANEKQLIIVFQNHSTQMKPVSMNMSGLNSSKKISKLTPYITSDNTEDDLKKYADINIDDVYEVPAKSVVTLVGTIVDSSGGNLPEFDESKVHLFQNYPNPFNHRTDFYYHLPESGRVQISIYSISGKKIKSLLDSTKDTGLHIVSWDGTNDKNISVSSGIYYYTLHAGSIRDQKKMVFTK